jgi:hypothetical protein
MNDRVERDRREGLANGLWRTAPICSTDSSPGSWQQCEVGSTTVLPDSQMTLPRDRDQCPLCTRSRSSLPPSPPLPPLGGGVRWPAFSSSLPNVASLKLPRDISGRQAAAAFMRDGWIKRDLGRTQGTGSHNIGLTKPGFTPMVIVDHDALRPGTLRRYIRHAKLSVPEFLALLH